MSTTYDGNFGCSRRRWLGAAAATGVTAALPNWVQAEQAPRQLGPDLFRPLTSEEAESARNSPLVTYALQLKSAGGYNCAELLLTAAVKCHGLPPQMGEPAAAFGGGVGHGELCGFLTGASMALGALAFKVGGDRTEVKKRLKGWNDALWAWWKPLAPLNCRDLRPQYDKAGFEAMLVRVCLAVDKIVLDRAKGSSG